MKDKAVVVAEALTNTKLSDDNIGQFHNMLSSLFSDNDDINLDALHFIVDEIYNAGKEAAVNA